MVGAIFWDLGLLEAELLEVELLDKEDLFAVVGEVAFKLENKTHFHKLSMVAVSFSWALIV